MGKIIVYILRISLSDGKHHPMIVTVMIMGSTILPVQVEFLFDCFSRRISVLRNKALTPEKPSFVTPLLFDCHDSSVNSNRLLTVDGT